MSLMLDRLDWLVVLLLVGPVGLGLYSVAFNWAAIGLYVANSISGAVFEDSRTLSDAAARRVMRSSAFVVGSVEFGLLLLAWPLIPALFGVAFTDAREVVPLLVPGVVAQAISRPAWQILVARGEGRLVRAVTMRSLLIGAPVLVLLTTSLGIRGAAVGSSLAYAIWAWMLSRHFTAHSPESTDVEST